MASIINATTTAGVSVQGDNSGSLQLATNNGTTAVTVTTAQNVGIGTTTPTDDGGYGKIVDIYGSTGGALYLHTSTATNYAFLGKYNASTQLADSGSAGLTFATASGSTPIERMRIDSSGYLIVGGTSQIGQISGYFNGAAVSGIGLQTSRASTGSNFMVFNNNAGNIAGFIQHNGTTTVNYSTSSDYRLKENIAPMTGALAKVAQLKPVTYTWKNTDGEQGEGFIAHELAEICPLAVSGEKDAINENGSIKAQGIDSSKLVAILTAAIQELKAELDATKAEIQALKGVA